MKATYIILAIMLLAGCIIPMAAIADGSKLAKGDVIDVIVDGEKDFSKQYQINGNGCILMPMVDAVKVVGLNTTDASAVITKALNKVLVNPQVSASFVERAKMQVYVVGQVNKRGLIEIGVGDRVLQALAQAGYDDTADLSHVNIRRGDEIIDLDLAKYLSGEDLTVNRELESGDTIVVSRVDMIGSVIASGQVTKVGSIPLKRNMTFREAMGLVGGITVEADPAKITVKREGTAEPIKIDYEKAMAGDPTADVILAPGDTIYVPELEISYFTIWGGVNRPGQYPFKGKLALSEAVGVAGGAVTNVGDLRKVKIMHASGPEAKVGESITVDLTQVIRGAADEPLVRRGDVIYVTEHKQKTNLWNAIQTLSPLWWIFR
ncbi:SLBB domain-containing protein [bacterium]|nr:SLBB domain-containing protein [bacterium]